jgi:hypothetical protein
LVNKKKSKYYIIDFLLTYVYYYLGILATVWCDKRPIHFLSSIHVAEKEGSTVSRKDGRGRRLHVTAPPTVIEYNKFMGGVDLNDKMTKLDKSRRTYKWYHRLFRKAVMWSMYNAYILEGCFVDHSPAAKRKRDFRSFVLDVAHSLVSECQQSNPANNNAIIGMSAKRLSNEDHIPVVGEGKDHVCVVCFKKYTLHSKAFPDMHYTNFPDECKKKKTIFKCSSIQCGVYLCIKPGSQCWKKWHKNVQYWR